MKYLMPTGETVEHEKLPTWKTPYNHDTNFVSDLHATYNDEPSLTKQEFKEQTDINFILEQFTRTGATPGVVMPEHFGDTTENLTWYDMQQRMAEATATFYELPANIRENSLNDPARWADAVTAAMHKGSLDKLDELGIDTRGMREDIRKAEEAKSQTTPGGGGHSSPHRVWDRLRSP